MKYWMTISRSLRARKAMVDPKFENRSREEGREGEMRGCPPEKKATRSPRMRVRARPVRASIGETPRSSVVWNVSG